MTASSALRAVTDFGDLAVLLPLTAAILVWLLREASRRNAAWWALATIACMGGTALLKALFFVCPPVDALQSPSGHTSLSTLVYGALAVLMAAQTQGWRRVALVVIGLAFVGAIATSRVLLGSHSPIEVGIGLAIGGGVLAAFGVSYLLDRPADPRLRPLVLGVVLFVMLFHGQHLHAENLFRAFGAQLQANGIACR